MIRGLAIETSGRVGSAAVVADGVVLAEQTFSQGLKHAAELLPRIDQLVRSAGWKPADIDELYVSVGPGAFTGLRIGVTLAKTLSFATGARVAAVSSVEALVGNAPPEARDLAIVLDARREQVFTARLHRAGASTPWEWIEPGHLDSLKDLLARAPRPLWLIGEGIPYHKQFLPTDDASVIIVPEESWRARAGAVAEIGYRMARQGRFTEAQALLPIYIRIPEAEEKRLRANG